MGWSFHESLPYSQGYSKIPTVGSMDGTASARLLLLTSALTTLSYIGLAHNPTPTLDRMLTRPYLSTKSTVNKQNAVLARLMQVSVWRNTSGTPLEASLVS